MCGTKELYSKDSVPGQVSADQSWSLLACVTWTQQYSDRSETKYILPIYDYTRYSTALSPCCLFKVSGSEGGDGGTAGVGEIERR